MKLLSEWGVAFFFSVVWLQSTARSSKIWNNEDNEIPFEVTPRKKKKQHTYSLRNFIPTRF